MNCSLSNRSRSAACQNTDWSAVNLRKKTQAARVRKGKWKQSLGTAILETGAVRSGWPGDCTAPLQSPRSMGVTRSANHSTVSPLENMPGERQLHPATPNETRERVRLLLQRIFPQNLLRSPRQRYHVLSQVTHILEAKNVKLFP